MQDQSLSALPRTYPFLPNKPLLLPPSGLVKLSLQPRAVLDPSLEEPYPEHACLSRASSLPARIILASAVKLRPSLLHHKHVLIRIVTTAQSTIFRYIQTRPRAGLLFRKWLKRTGQLILHSQNMNELSTHLCAACTVSCGHQQRDFPGGFHEQVFLHSNQQQLLRAPAHCNSSKPSCCVGQILYLL